MLPRCVESLSITDFHCCSEVYSLLCCSPRQHAVVPWWWCQCLQFSGSSQPAAASVPFSKQTKRVRLSSWVVEDRIARHGTNTESRSPAKGQFRLCCSWGRVDLTTFGRPHPDISCCRCVCHATAQLSTTADCLSCTCIIGTTPRLSAQSRLDSAPAAYTGL